MFATALKINDGKDRQVRATPPARAQSADGALFEGLICELHWTALQIGGITSILNACKERGQSAVPTSCRNQFPVELPIVYAALSSWDVLGIPTSLANRVERLYKNLALAKLSTEPFIGAAQAAQTGKANALAFEAITQLSVLWRSLANDACEAVNALEPEVRWRVGGLYSENTLMLSRLLKDAIQGKFACVDGQGEIILPVLPQRRRAQRFALQQNCRIGVRGKIIPGYANDVSMYGMGLACGFAFKLKESIVIEI